MAGINRVTLIGNLGAEPDIKHLPDGGQIANLRLATSERWRDKTTGEVQERTYFSNAKARSADTDTADTEA